MPICSHLYPASLECGIYTGEGSKSGRGGVKDKSGIEGVKFQSGIEGVKD